MDSGVKFLACLTVGMLIGCASARAAHRRQVQGDQARSQVQAIFARCVEAHPETHGVFVVQIRLQPDGKPASMELQNDSASHSLGSLELQRAPGAAPPGVDPEFEQCMSKDVLAIQFPPPGGDPAVKIMVHTHGEVSVRKIDANGPNP